MVLNPTAGSLEHKTCLGCRYVKGKVLVTGHARNQEVEELFRVLVIGFVGLQYPKTANHGGNPWCDLYRFTCVCQFGEWFGTTPTTSCGSVVAAEIFGARVMLGLAGVPARRPGESICQRCNFVSICDQRN